MSLDRAGGQHRHDLVSTEEDFIRESAEDMAFMASPWKGNLFVDGLHELLR